MPRLEAAARLLCAATGQDPERVVFMGRALPAFSTPEGVAYGAPSQDSIGPLWRFYLKQAEAVLGARQT